MALNSGSGPGRNREFAPLFYIVMALMASLSGCAADFAALRPGLEVRGHYIDGVPFFRQEESWCGSAALAGVTSFWGREIGLEQISSRVRIPQLRGVLPMDMVSFLNEYGFETKSFAGTLDDLRVLVRSDLPVISLLDLGFNRYRQPRYVTVIGFDDASEVIIAHDGLTANKVIEYEKFMKAWERAGRWMIVAVPRTILTKNQ